MTKLGLAVYPSPPRLQNISVIALAIQLSEFKQRFDGINPAEIRKLADEKRKLEQATQLKAASFAGQLQGRVIQIITPPAFVTDP